MQDAVTYLHKAGEANYNVVFRFIFCRMSTKKVGWFVSHILGTSMSAQYVETYLARSENLYGADAPGYVFLCCFLEKVCSKFMSGCSCKQQVGMLLAFVLQNSHPPRTVIMSVCSASGFQDFSFSTFTMYVVKNNGAFGLAISSQNAYASIGQPHPWLAEVNGQYVNMVRRGIGS